MYIFICIKSCAFYALKDFYIIGVLHSIAGVILLEDEITPPSVCITGSPFRLAPVSCWYNLSSPWELPCLGAQGVPDSLSSFPAPVAYLSFREHLVLFSGKWDLATTCEILGHSLLQGCHCFQVLCCRQRCPDIRFIRELSQDQHLWRGGSFGAVLSWDASPGLYYPGPVIRCEFPWKGSLTMVKTINWSNSQKVISDIEQLPSNFSNSFNCV